VVTIIITVGAIEWLGHDWNHAKRAVSILPTASAGILFAVRVNNAAGESDLAGRVQVSLHAYLPTQDTNRTRLH